MLKAKNRRLITWVFNHAGYESLNAVRDHYARGNMPISHEDAIQIIEDVTDEGKEDWSKEHTLYTDDNIANERNLGMVLQNRRARAQEARVNKDLEEKLRRRNQLDGAIDRCQRMPNGQLYCARDE